MAEKAWHITTIRRTGGTPRVTDVDLEPSSEGGEDIGWIGAGEWVRYTVSVAATGSYLLQIESPRRTVVECSMWTRAGRT